MIDYDTLSSDYGVSGWSSLNIHATAVLTVDNTFTLDMCTLRLAPGEIVIISSTGHLIIDNSLISHCDGKWNTILVQPGGQITVTNGSTIEYADTAITSLNNASLFGDFQIDESRLRFNCIGLTINAPGPTTLSTHPGSIQNSEITAPTTFLGVPGIAGIQVRNIRGGEGVILGNTSATVFDLPASFNFIHDVQIGIRSWNSSLKVQNNRFEDIPVSFPYVEGAAIASTDGSNENLYVGAPDVGISGVNNTTENCQYSVVAKDIAKCEVLDNHFSGNYTGSQWTQRRAIVGINNNEMYIRRNQIKDFHEYGIWLRNPGQLVFITDNIIENTVVDNSFSSITGIRVQSTIGAGMNVRRNTIRKVNIGIDHANVNSLISNNVINFFQAQPGDKVYGILINNNFEPEIDSNIIDGNCLGCPGKNTIVGIGINLSEGFQARYNNVGSCETGIGATGFCPGGNFNCNRIDTCGFGFVLSGMLLGGLDVGPITRDLANLDPADNHWFPDNTANRTMAVNETQGSTFGVDTIIWMYRDSVTLEYEMEFSSGLNDKDAGVSSKVDPFVSNNGAFCTSISMRLADDAIDNAGARARQNKFSHHLEALGGFNDNPCEFRSSQRYLINHFNAQPDELLIGHSSDFSFASALSKISTGSVDELIKVTNSLKERDFTTAQLIHTSIGSLCLQDDLLIETQEILFNHIEDDVPWYDQIAGDFHYTSSEQKRLEEIAVQNPYSNGHGVFLAQALLGITNEYDSPLYRQIPTPTEQQEHTIVFYPNPTNGKLFVVESDWVTNNKVSATSLFSGVTTTLQLDGDQLDLSDLLSGTYLLSFMQENQQIFTQLIHVLKER